MNAFFAKHEPDARPDELVADRIRELSQDGRIACAAAFTIAAGLAKPPAAIGHNIDLLGIRLVQCQLGLFGYFPQKKIVLPADPVDLQVQRAIEQALCDGRLPCQAAFAIAAALSIPKMSVSAVCEALKIRIKPCQLGAF